MFRLFISMSRDPAKTTEEWLRLVLLMLLWLEYEDYRFSNLNKHSVNLWTYIWIETFPFFIYSIISTFNNAMQWWAYRRVRPWANYILLLSTTYMFYKTEKSTIISCLYFDLTRRGQTLCELTHYLLNTTPPPFTWQKCLHLS